MAATGILPSHWYYNTESGELTNGNNLENLGNNLLGGLGWHELNIPGSDTEAQAAAEAEKEFPGGKTPTSSLATGAANEVANQAGSLFSLAGLHLTWPGAHTFLGRALKIIVGGVMLIAGILKMTGADKAAIPVAGAVAGKLPGV